MNREQFLSRLRMGLSGLPQADIEERVNFYSEMIDDRIEDGLSEEEAVKQVGPVEDIVHQTIYETPLARLVKERITPKKKTSGARIALIIITFPLWIGLVGAAFGIIVGLFAVLFSLIVATWSVFISLAAGAVAGLVGGVITACFRSVLSGLVLISGAMVCGGLAIYMFYIAKAVSRGLMKLARLLSIGIKNLFVKKEDI